MRIRNGLLIIANPTDYSDELADRISQNGAVITQGNDAEEALSVLGMLGLHRHNQVLETTVRRQRSGESVPRVVSSRLALFELLDNDLINTAHLSKVHSLAINQTQSDFTPFSITEESTGELTVSHDPRYVPVQTLEEYDKKSNLLQQTGHDDITTSQLYSYEYSLPIAQVVAAARNQIAYTSFEAPDEGGILTKDKDGNFSWNHRDATFYNEGHTGKRSYSGSIEAKNLPPNCYMITCWAKRKEGNSNSTVYAVVPNATQEAGADWTYLQWIFDSTNGFSELVINRTISFKMVLHPNEQESKNTRPSTATPPFLPIPSSGSYFEPPGRRLLSINYLSY